MKHHPKEKIKVSDTTPAPTEEKESYTPDEVKKLIHDAQSAQLAADEMRINGNAFFAEAIDHIAQLAARDPFWRTVLKYGQIFEQQFKINTGQIQPQAPPAASPPPAPSTAPNLRKPGEQATPEGTPGDE